MTKVTPVIFLFLILASFQVKIDPSLLVGKWRLTSHFYMNGTKKQFCDCKIYSPEISIFSDGTYIITLKGKSVQKGKWKLNSGDILFFYNNYDVPDDPKTIIHDQACKLISVGKEKLVITEVVCDEATEGQSTYIRTR